MGENVIKITGKIGASQTFYVTGDGDYDTLKNIPIINLTGTDEEPILLNTLETGLYRLNGIYRVNASETDKTQAENRLTIVKRVSGNDIYLQMLKPQGNIVEFYHITEVDTLHKEVVLSNLATVQDIPTKVSELENDSKYITEAELKTFGYATEEFVRSQGYLTEETDPTVPDHVKNITEADINKWNEKYQLPVASQTTLGGIKVGNNLSIGQDGTLNAEKSTQSYAELTNKPKINNVELDGEKSLNDLGIQAQGNYATKEELPTKTSQLENDSNFISEIPVASTSTLGGIKVGDNLEITADGVLNALGSDFPIIDATGDIEVDLDNYLEECTWIIKGNNVKQMKNSVYESVKTAPSAILTIRTVNGATYQSLEFPSSAYSTSTGYNIYNYIGARKIKPSIDERFQFFNTPTRITNNYTSGIFNDAQSHAFSQSGANELYTEIIEAIGKFGTSSGLAKLTKLKTTDKKSLVNAINELVDIKQDKLTAGDGITIENNVISALGGGEVFKYIHEIEPAEGEIFDLATLIDDGIYYCHSQGTSRDERYKNKLSNEIGYGDFVVIISSGMQNKPTTPNSDRFVARMDITALDYIYFSIYNGTNHYAARTGKYDTRFTSKIWLTPKSNFTLSSSFIPNMGAIQNLAQYIASNYNNIPTLSTLTTTDKTSLVKAINEINAKISSGTLATNLAEVQGYDATKTQVLKNINGQFTWVEE